MHLTSITLFIRGDKQFAEKRRRQLRRRRRVRSYAVYENFYRALASVAIFENIVESAKRAVKHAGVGRGEPRQRIHKLAFRKFH